MKPYHIQEQLERRILRGLACEWKEALWVLDATHAAAMRMPHLSLGNMKKKLGYWSPEKREICLGRNFVLNHPWDAVREVLLHEMAHQFAHEVLGAEGQPPHGPAFQRACHLLRANPEASGTYKPLGHRISRESSGSQDRIMLKVKKLMALAQSSNQHEAELAMAKAHELIARHNVDLLSRERERDFVSFFLGQPALRHFREDYHLSNLLQNFYFVYAIWVPAYVLAKEKMGRVLEISGTVQNTKIASYVYDFVKRFIDSQWSQYNEDRRLNRYRKTDFAVGILEGFRAKLETQKGSGNKPAASRALVRGNDPVLLEYAAHRYPYTRSVGKRVAAQDTHILKDGIEVGKGLVISRGITHRGTRRTALIENKKA